MSAAADRELLELAAKAAGHTLSAEWNCAESGIFIGRGVDGDLLRAWNPLADDGDALRLAVKLNIDVSQCPNTAQAGYGWPRSYLHVMLREVAGDRLAATRRAIVRAAAEIGKAMP